ncbi:MAG: hypothetical protein K4571_01815, partial [Deltaproteobacteria bacterium]
AAAYSANPKVAVKRTTAAAATMVPNVFFMICYLLRGCLSICLYTNEKSVPEFRNGSLIIAT